MAHALHNLISDVCDKGGKICATTTPAPSGIDLLKYIRNVTFTSKRHLTWPDAVVIDKFQVLFLTTLR